MKSNKELILETIEYLRPKSGHVNVVDTIWNNLKLDSEQKEHQRKLLLKGELINLGEDQWSMKLTAKGLLLKESQLNENGFLIEDITKKSLFNKHKAWIIPGVIVPFVVFLLGINWNRDRLFITPEKFDLHLTKNYWVYEFDLRVSKKGDYEPVIDKVFIQMQVSDTLGKSMGSPIVMIEFEKSISNNNVPLHKSDTIDWTKLDGEQFRKINKEKMQIILSYEVISSENEKLKKTQKLDLKPSESWDMTKVFLGAGAVIDSTGRVADILQETGVLDLLLNSIKFELAESVTTKINY